MNALLSVTGSVDQPGEYDFEALTGLPEQIADVSGLAPGRQGGAVRLSALLEVAKPAPGVRYITLEADGDYSASVPLDAIADQAVVLYRLGAGPLPVEQGGPLRFLIPDVTACKTADVDKCANVKYLRRIVLSAEPGKDTRPRTLELHAALHAREHDGPPA